MPSILMHREITNLVLKAFYAVYRELGYGFLEKVYENALALEAANLGLAVCQQAPIDVMYKGHLMGHYEADLVVNNLVIVELKAVDQLSKNMRHSC